MAFELPPLPYDYTALEPHIDEQTMHLHHDKHHQAYVTNLNNALQGQSQFESLAIEDLMRRINEVPENIRTAVRNNGGGHVNHSMFWQIMKPNGGGEPTGALAQAISQTFGSFDQFKAAFNDAGTKRFGSGWAWLVLDSSGKLQVISTANQVGRTQSFRVMQDIAEQAAPHDGLGIVGFAGVAAGAIFMRDAVPIEKVLLLYEPFASAFPYESLA